MIASRAYCEYVTAGVGLNNREVVELCVREGQRRSHVHERGVAFANDLSREGGHSKRRVLHATDMTGREIQRALIETARQHPNIDIHEHHTAVDLIRRQKVVCDSQPDRIVGAHILDEETGMVHSVGAKIVVLASGGAGKVYLYTSNPDVATGDGEDGISLKPRSPTWSSSLHPTRSTIRGQRHF